MNKHEIVQRYARKLVTFFDFCDALAQHSTCKRHKVGAIVFPTSCSGVYSLGYNSPARGRSNDACTNVAGSCGCAHAEANAMIKLDPSRCKPGTCMYVTMTPCVACANAIVNSNVVCQLFYHEKYRDDEGMNIIREAKIDAMKSDCVRDIASNADACYALPNHVDALLVLRRMNG